MKNTSLIFSFDIGTGSLGESVRTGNKFSHVQSFLYPDHFAETKTAAMLRRQMRTRMAHKAREHWLDKKLEEFGIEVLKRRVTAFKDGKWQLMQKGDERLEREFPRDGDNTCYNSIALRCKLLLGKRLEGWQVYKALNSAIQNRGYDVDIPWKENERKDDEAGEISESMRVFDDELKSMLDEIEGDTPSKFAYPCFLKARNMGLWNPLNPDFIDVRITRDAEAAKGYVVPRLYVAEEFTALVESAAKMFPKLKGMALYLLYGPAEKAYASFYPECREKFGLKLGAESDMQGVMSQKLPRFDNRIIDKCSLIPRFNVCKITPLDKAKAEDDMLYHAITFAMKLKNLRFLRDDGTIGAFDFDEFKKAYEVGSKTGYKFTKAGLKKHLAKIGCSPLTDDSEEIDAPAQSGRASFCRPAMRILKELIFSGKSPSEFLKGMRIENTDPKKGLIAEDLEFLKLLGDCSWEKLYIPNVKIEILSRREIRDKEAQIRRLIGSQNDPIVRHRLFSFYARLKMLGEKFGTPDKVALEFVRDDFIGKKKKIEIQKIQKQNRDDKIRAARELDEVGVKGGRVLLKYRLHKIQDGRCIYTGKTIGIKELDSAEIEHIVPRSKGGPDAIYNYVLCTGEANAQKGDRTPYEWLSGGSEWLPYLERVKGLWRSLGKKRYDLLTSRDAVEHVQKYTSLAETAWIAKLAQTIVCMHFGFPMSGQVGEKKVIVVSGGMTAAARQSCGLNGLLHNENLSGDMSNEDFVRATIESEFKNRDNKKHHALDSMVISYLAEFASGPKKQSFRFPADMGDPKEFFGKYLDNLIPNFLAYKKPALEDGIYGMRSIDGKPAMVRKYTFEGLAYKKVNMKDVYSLESLLKSAEKVVSPQIRGELKKFADTSPVESEWKDFCSNFRIPDKNGNLGTRVKRVVMRVGEPDEYKDLSKDGSGAWRKGDGNKCQIVWRDKGGKYRVAPVYVHASQSAVISELEKNPNFAGIYGVFRSLQLVSLDRDVKDAKGELRLKKGIYKLNTIRSDAYVQVTSTDGEPSKPININYLIAAGLKGVSVE